MNKILHKFTISLRENKIYFSLMAAIFAITLVVNFFQLSYTSYNIEQENIETYQMYSTSSLKQLVTQTDQVLTAAYNYAFQLSVSSDLISEIFYGGTEKNIKDIFLQKYSKYKLNVPYLYDTAFYNSQTGSLFRLSTMTHLSPSEYWGDSFDIGTLINLEHNKVALRKNPDIKPLSFYNPPLLLTICFNVDPFLDNYIIVDLDFSKIQSTFAQYTRDSNCRLYVEDAANNPVFSTINDISEDEKFRSDISCNSLAFYATSSYGGEKYALSCVRSEDFKLSFVSLTDYDSIIKNNIMQKQVWFTLVYSVIILAGLVALYFAMRRLYHPIREMTIRNTRYEAHSKNMQMQQYLYEFLSSPLMNDDKIKKVEAYLTEKLGKTDKINLVLMAVDSYSDFCDNFTISERQAYNYGILNICEEIISGEYPCLTAFHGETDLIILIASETPAEGLINHIDLCRSLVEENLELSISAAISEPTAFEQLDEAYIDMRKLLQYRLLYGNNISLTPTAFKNSRHLTLDDLSPVIAKINDDITNDNFDNLNASFEAFIDMIKHSTPDAIISHCAYLMTSIFEILNHQARILGQVDFQTHAELLKLSKIETIDNIYTIFSDIFNKLKDTKTAGVQNKYQSTIEKICKMIEKNYSDASLCADSIAGVLGFSPAYLRRIFKHSTGKSLASMILYKRLEESAKLVANSNLPIKDIFSKCGFASNSYFSVLFKKSYGMSPIEYRNAALESSSLPTIPDNFEE